MSQGPVRDQILVEYNLMNVPECRQVRNKVGNRGSGDRVVSMGIVLGRNR
jgi:hypothetical protein